MIQDGKYARYAIAKFQIRKLYYLLELYNKVGDNKNRKNNKLKKEISGLPALVQVISQ